MSEPILIHVNDRPVSTQSGSTVAAALLAAGISARNFVSGEPRPPLCGIGICYECRVEIDGLPHQRACMVFCQASMRVRTE